MAEPLTRREDYRWFTEIAPRWRDNDVFGHVNNAVFYEYVDTTVGRWIIGSGALDIPHGDVVGLAAETGCKYFSALAFPDPVAVGLRVGHIGNSSVRYELAFFRGEAETPAAEAFFLHVYVDSATHRPVPLPEAFRAALEGIAVG